MKRAVKNQRKKKPLPFKGTFADLKYEKMKAIKEQNFDLAAALRDLEKIVEGMYFDVPLDKKVVLKKAYITIPKKGGVIHDLQLLTPTYYQRYVKKYGNENFKWYESGFGVKPKGKRVQLPISKRFKKKK